MSNKKQTLTMLPVDLIIPLYKPGHYARLLCDSLKLQSIQFNKIIVVDSGSQESEIAPFREIGAEVHSIKSADFNHGGTRNSAFNALTSAEYIVFMTQDAILANPDAVQLLVNCFEDSAVGAAYGRQLPATDACTIAAHARLYNYPPESRVSSRADIPLLGMKSAFISNSFAAYRREALQLVGGFPPDVIFGEDTCVAAKMLKNNLKIAYCSEAQVWHSHNYSLLEEFRRYFDIGVFHSREKWFLELLGKAEGEGKRFVLSEIKYLFKKAPIYIPVAAIRTFLKFAAYRIGLLEQNLPCGVSKRLSMSKAYWQ